jgi:hypothetical protein
MDIEAITTLSSGATFFRGDLHVHSFGASHDVSDRDATPENIVAVASGGGCVGRDRGGRGEGSVATRGSLTLWTLCDTFGQMTERRHAMWPHWTG